MIQQFRLNSAKTHKKPGYFVVSDDLTFACDVRSFLPDYCINCSKYLMSRGEWNDMLEACLLLLCAIMMS